MKIVIFMGLLAQSSAILGSGAAKALRDRSIDEILDQYVIVGDFTPKASLRDNSREIFWRYPLKLPSVTFPIEAPRPGTSEFNAAFPRSDGEGRPLEHMNLGRILFLDGQYEKARKVWLGARARYGTNYKFHRRTDYFIASSFLYQGLEKLEAHGKDFEHEDVRGWFVNTSTFYSWSYGVKKDLPDPLLDGLAPRSFYNLSAIYFRYKKWTAAFGTMEDGFNYLKRTGRKEFRTQFRRMKSELFIRNRDYLSAVQQMDIALRQDRDPEQAALIFARIGDIYFDLNNFELAEDMYALAISLDRRQDKLRPWQFVLRGECLFWLGKFEQSIKMMRYGLASLSSTRVVGDLPLDFQALASIRIADAQLALGQTEKAKLSYYQHIREFRSHDTVHVAKLREACLELPFYDGNNISHARGILRGLKEESTLPLVAQELVWTCEMASLAQHDRNPELIERVRSFHSRYPRSEFLKSLIAPVRSIQVKNIEPFFKSGDVYGAVGFYEQTRETLFPEVPEEYQKPLFEAYVEISRSAAARDLYDSYKAESDEEWIRKAVMVSELAGGGEARWNQESLAVGQKLRDRSWKIAFTKPIHLFIDRILSSKGGADHYLWIYDLARSWVESNFGVACDIVYPVLQRLGDDREHFSESTFKAMSRGFIARYLEDMLKYETFCAYSVLEFELDLFRSQPKKLGESYLQRDYIPVNNVTVSLFYALAELNEGAGNKQLSKALWRKIVADGSGDLPEVRYAQARLDGRRTELEKLWK